MLARSATWGRSIVSMCAPVRRSVSSVRSNANATAGSSPSRNVPEGTARRQADSGAGLRVTRRAARISCANTASRTVRVRAQAVSSVVDSGTAPEVGTSRAVFLKPTMPLRAAGMRIEPPVSEPRPMKAAPVATDTAAPEDDPPGTRAGPSRAPKRPSQAAGVPWCGLVPTPEKANSTMFVRPMKDAPAARSRATAGLSQGAGGASASTTEPAGVGWPCMSNRSLTETARPASGKCATPGLAALAQASSNKARVKTRAQAVERAVARDFSISAQALVCAACSMRRVVSRSLGMLVLESLGFAGCKNRARQIANQSHQGVAARKAANVGLDFRPNLWSIFMSVTMREMLEAGVHFGHQTRFWNPKMAPYIFGHRNKIHIINLEKSLPLFQEAQKFAKQLAANRGTILMVGTKRQAREILATEAQRAGVPFVDQRWLGGMLTNFKTVKTSIKRLKDMKAQQEAGLDSLSKKEQLTFSREIEKLEKDIGGIQDMAALPDAIFIIDVGFHKIAVAEAKKLGIPLIGVVDTNHSPEGIDYVIPGNDDSAKAVTLYARGIADAIIEGRANAVNEVVKAATAESTDEFVEVQEAAA